MFKGQLLMTQISKAQSTREGSFGFLIQSLSRTLDEKMKIELAKVGVNVKLFAALMLLSEEDGINQRKVGERLNFPEYFTSRNIDALVEAGFAERRPDPKSRRAFLVYLTDAGHAKAAELPPIVRRVNDDILTSLSNAERVQVVELLQKSTGVGSREG